MVTVEFKKTADYDTFRNIWIENILIDANNVGGNVWRRRYSAMIERIKKSSSATMSDWLRTNFGPTLHDMFFGPFHQLHTAGLVNRIAPKTFRRR